MSLLGHHEFLAMLSSCDTHQVSIYDWQYIVGVGSLMRLLISYLDTIHSPIYQSNTAYDHLWSYLGHSAIKEQSQKKEGKQ